MSHASSGFRGELPVALGVFLGLAVLSLGIGDLWLNPVRVLQGLIGRDELASVVVWQIRMPRTIVACLVGASLSASGLVMQAYFRNSLASPGLLGVSSGGAAGAVLAIALGGGVLSIVTVPLMAILGACVATGAVLLLARSGAGTERLLLSGVALNALLGAVTSYVLSSGTLGYERNAQIVFWLLGGLEDRTWEHVCIGSPIVVCALLLIPLGRPMDLLSLGSLEAQSLGVNVPKVRRHLLILSTILTALGTAVAGTVGFVGLVVPHLLRMMVGAEHRRLVPLSLIGGGAFVLACDLGGRMFGSLRLGVVTALVGGPFFLWLLRRRE